MDCSVKYKRDIMHTYLSVARLSFAIDGKSSVLLAALMLVIGVFAKLPPFVEPAGVEVEVESSTPAGALTCEFFFAAFSASRFCFEDEGGIVVKIESAISRK